MPDHVNMLHRDAYIYLVSFENSSFGFTGLKAVSIKLKVAVQVDMTLIPHAAGQ